VARYDKIHLVLFGEYVPSGPVILHCTVAEFADAGGGGWALSTR